MLVLQHYLNLIYTDQLGTYRPDVSPARPDDDDVESIYCPSELACCADNHELPARPTSAVRASSVVCLFSKVLLLH